MDTEPKQDDLKDNSMELGTWGSIAAGVATLPVAAGLARLLLKMLMDAIAAGGKRATT